MRNEILGVDRRRATAALSDDRVAKRVAEIERELSALDGQIERARADETKHAETSRVALLVADQAVKDAFASWETAKLALRDITQRDGGRAQELAQKTGALEREKIELQLEIVDLAKLPKDWQAFEYSLPRLKRDLARQRAVAAFYSKLDAGEMPAFEV